MRGAGTPPGCSSIFDSEPGVSLRSTARLIAGTPAGVQSFRQRMHRVLEARATRCTVEVLPSGGAPKKPPEGGTTSVFTESPPLHQHAVCRIPAVRRAGGDTIPTEL